MEVKLFEIRDRATFIPLMAIKLGPTNEAERYLLSRAGFGMHAEDQSRHVLLAQIDGGNGEIHCDAYDWKNSRTYANTHNYIREYFDTLTSGEVIDVEFILGESDHKKISERLG